MSRGDRREEIFHDDLDREDFLKTLGAACQKSGWQVRAYCLMSNDEEEQIRVRSADCVCGNSNLRWPG
jgi:hypothetical protein